MIIFCFFHLRISNAEYLVARNSGRAPRVVEMGRAVQVKFWTCLVHILVLETPSSLSKGMEIMSMSNDISGVS